MARSRRWLVFLVAVACFRLPPDAFAQEEERVITGATCGTCAARMRRITTLRGDLQGAELSVRTRVVRAGDGRYYAAPTYSLGEIAVFGPDGTFLHVMGRAGKGPGELSEITGLFISPRDSLYVADQDLRVSVFAPDESFGRSFNVPGSVQDLIPLDAPGEMVLHINPVFGSDIAPVYLYSAGELRPLTWPTDDTGRPILLRLAGVEAGDLWITGTDEYLARVFDWSGALLWTLRRELSWFPPARTVPEQRPPARIIDAVVAGGKLWLLISRRVPVDPASAGGRHGPRRRAESGIRQLNVTEMADRYEYYVDVIDTRSGDLITSARFEDRVIGGFVSGTDLWEYAQSEEGLVSLNIWHLWLREPKPKAGRHDPACQVVYARVSEYLQPLTDRRNRRPASGGMPRL